MPRPPRLDLPGYPRHLGNRGVNGMACFAADRDRHVYLEYLREALADSNGQLHLHAFVLMTNHVHLLVTAERAGVVPAAMQRVGTRYARYFNATQGRTGPVFAGRYWASTIKTERYVFEAMRYIELNPVRAGMVSRPEEYPWSSYRHNAGGTQREEITFHDAYLGMGETRESRARAWADLVAEGTDPIQLGHIRRCVWRGRQLGDPPVPPVPGT